MIREKDKGEERAKLAEEQRLRTNNFKDAVGLAVEKEPSEKPKQLLWSDMVEQSKKKEEEKRNQRKEDNIEKKWRKQIQIKEKIDKVNDDLDDKEKKILIEKETKILKKKEKEEKIIKLKDEFKIGDSSGDSHDENDWSWDESDQDWNGTEERKEKEIRKKIDRYRRKKNLEEKTARKAHHMIGLGPVRQSSIDFFLVATADYTLAKEMAIREFLVEYLQFTEQEVEDDFMILDTMIAKEKDNVYVTFADHSNIHDIQSRITEVRLDEVSTRVYVPPQYWAKYTHLSNYCKTLRSENKDIKTIIRFAEKDLEVLTKNRNHDDHYKIIPLEEIEKLDKIPKFDHSIKWKHRVDKPPKSIVKPVLTKIVPPSIRGTELQRQRSTENSTSAPTKRPRKDANDQMHTSD